MTKVGALSGGKFSQGHWLQDVFGWEQGQFAFTYFKLSLVTYLMIDD
jgi:hypothetical protein